MNGIEAERERDTQTVEFNPTFKLGGEVVLFV